MGELENGIPIFPGTKGNDQIGFTQDRFTADSYLFCEGDTVTFSLIIARKPGRGHFSDLVRTAEKSGYKVQVPTPFGHMEKILKHLGFHETVVESDIGPVDLWVRGNPSPST